MIYNNRFFVSNRDILHNLHPQEQAVVIYPNDQQRVFANKTCIHTLKREYVNRTTTVHFQQTVHYTYALTP